MYSVIGVSLIHTVLRNLVHVYLEEIFIALCYGIASVLGYLALASLSYVLFFSSKKVVLLKHEFPNIIVLHTFSPFSPGEGFGSTDNFERC